MIVVTVAVAYHKISDISSMDREKSPEDYDI